MQARLARLRPPLSMIRLTSYLRICSPVAGPASPPHPRSSSRPAPAAAPAAAASPAAGCSAARPCRLVPFQPTGSSASMSGTPRRASALQVPADQHAWAYTLSLSFCYSHARGAPDHPHVCCSTAAASGASTGARAVCCSTQEALHKLLTVANMEPDMLSVWRAPACGPRSPSPSTLSMLSSRRSS